MYRVTHLLANLGWVDFDLGGTPSCPAPYATFPSAHAGLGRQGCVAKKVTFRNVPTGRYKFRGLVRFVGKLHHEKPCKRTNLPKRTYQWVRFET